MLATMNHCSPPLCRSTSALGVFSQPRLSSPVGVSKREQGVPSRGQLAPEQQQALWALSRQVIAQLELRRTIAALEAAFPGADVRSLVVSQPEVLTHDVARVRLVECSSDRPYRLACIEPLRDTTTVADLAGGRHQIVEALSQAVYTLSQIVGNTASDLTEALQDTSDIERLVYRLGAAAMDEPDERQALLEERSLLNRTGMVLNSLSDLIALSSCHLGASAPA